MTIDVPQGVKSLRKGFNVALLAVLLETIDCPDKRLCASLLTGFQLYGDLRDDDSHIFRKKSEEEITRKLPAFNQALAELHDHETNILWFETCDSITMTQGTEAPQMRKRKMIVDVDINASREELLLEVFRETLDQERKGFLGPAMSKERLLATHTVDGVFLARPLPRFDINRMGNENALY